MRSPMVGGSSRSSFPPCPCRSSRTRRSGAPSPQPSAATCPGTLRTRPDTLRSAYDVLEVNIQLALEYCKKLARPDGPVGGAPIAIMVAERDGWGSGRRGSDNIRTR